VKINHIKNKIIGIFTGCCLIFGVFFILANIAYAIDTYQPLENITIGEFIYNDDYTPTADDCTISIYNPVTLVAEVDNETMTDEGTVAVTGWHYYNWTTLATEGKYPAMITCGPDLDDNILKLDKSFIVKAPVVTDSSIAAAVDVNTSSEVSAAVTSVNAHSDTNTSSLPASIWGYTSRTLSSFGTLVADVATAVWGSATRSLTTYGTLIADVWNNGTRTLTAGGLSASDVWTYGTRNLTDATLTSGSLATATDVTSATSPLATSAGLTSAVSPLATSAGLASAVAPLATSANVTSSTSTITGAISALNNITAADVWLSPTRSLTTYGSLVADVWNNWTRTLTDGGSGGSGASAADIWSYGSRTLTSLTLSSQTPWSVTTSDFGSITAGQNYLATVYVFYNGNLTDPMNSPTVIVYDPSRNVVVNGASMTKTPNTVGTFTYLYTTASNAAAGTWETDFLVPVATGNTLPGSDYWTVVTNPARVAINSISNVTVPSISANVTIRDEGLSGYEYHYEWCVVSDINNPCGGGDDIFHATESTWINAGQDFNTTLTATVPNPGNYYFKVIVYFGTESSGASRSFTAISSGGGGGGGGGENVPPPVVGVCGKRADFNCDGKVNSIDFSVLLYYWKSKPPFKNLYVDINKDGKVDSVDFSILLYEWGK
jgi:hypothetical protein